MVPVEDGGRPTSAKGRRASGGSKSSVETEVVRVSTTPELDSRQAAVLRILRDEAGGLTIGQIQARLSWPAGKTAPVVHELRRIGLVTRLNTIVPSYAFRADVGQDG